MGNTLGGKKKTTKVMKIDGETMKLRTPIKAAEVVKDYPGHALLESEAVKHYGVRAKALEPEQELEARRLYFLVELPKTPTEKAARRVRSGINMSAKDRLESLMLARRSTSDLSIMKPSFVGGRDEEERMNDNNGGLRVKMRLPKAEVRRLMQESKDEGEAAAKILDLCMANKGKDDRQHGEEGILLEQQLHWKSGHGRASQGMIKPRDQKRVSFLPVSEGEIQIAVASC